MHAIFENIQGIQKSNFICTIKGYYDKCDANAFANYKSKGKCYDGILKFTSPTVTQPLIESKYRYILLNAELTENIIIETIVLRAARQGSIILQVDYLKVLLKFSNFLKNFSHLKSLSKYSTVLVLLYQIVQKPIAALNT